MRRREPAELLHSSSQRVSLFIWFSWVLAGFIYWYKSTSVYRAPLSQVPSAEPFVECPTADHHNIFLTQSWVHKSIQAECTPVISVRLCQSDTLGGIEPWEKAILSLSAEEHLPSNEVVKDLCSNGIWPTPEALDQISTKMLERLKIGQYAESVQFIYIHEKRNGGPSVLVSAELSLMVTPIYPRSKLKPWIKEVDDKESYRPPISTELRFLFLSDDQVSLRNLNPSHIFDHASLTSLIDKLELLSAEIHVSTRIVLEAGVSEMLSKTDDEFLPEFYSKSRDWESSVLLPTITHARPPETLRLAIYFPNESGVTIQGHKSFRLVDWGVFVIAPTTTDADSQLYYATRLLIPHMREMLGLPAVDMAQYFGLKAISRNNGFIDAKEILIKRPSSIATWELNQLVLTATWAHRREARNNLEGFIQLINAQSDLVLLPEVTNKFELAVKQLELSYTENSILERLRKAHFANKLSQEVLFDDTVVSLAYFPMDHKAGMYLPLSLPFSLPLCVILLNELQNWRKNRAKTHIS